MRAERGENATHFASVRNEHRTQCVNGTLDVWDAGKGVCCEYLVRKDFAKLAGVQSFIIRPRTPLTANWLRIANRHMDYKFKRLVAHPAPEKYPRCCFHHEFGYPINWAELKGDIFQPLMRMYNLHLRVNLPPNQGLRNSREDFESLGSGRYGWIDLRQPP
jgi:hypothetical protein